MAATAAVAAWLGGPSGARGDEPSWPPPAQGIAVGEWRFRPSLEVRLRGEYRNAPVDLSGKVFDSAAVLGDAPDRSEPAVAETEVRVTDETLIAERTRVGLAVDRGPVTAAVVLQDSRGLGVPGPAADERQRPAPSLGLWQAYVDLHQTRKRGAFLRLGRQRVVFGDGRLVGESDWSPAPRALDAARAGFSAGDVDVQAVAALLAAPGTASRTLPESGPVVVVSGPGAQIYGLDGVWHLWPLLSFELTTLARVVREPRPYGLVPSDTYVVDLRAFGDRRGFRWALEGAYETGRVASFGANRDLSAFAAAGRAELETSLWSHPTFGVHAAFASGDDTPAPAGTPASGSPGALHRFDPILPEARGDMGAMGSWAWSNVLTAGADVSVAPDDDFTAAVGWRIAALAQPTDRWTTADLVPVGADPANGDRLLGNEIDVGLRWTPWEPLALGAGYGALVLGSGAKNVLVAAGRCTSESGACTAPDAEHWVYLSASVRAP